MLSKPVSAKVIFALALVILMTWAGHTSALFVGSSQPVLTGINNAHTHVHGADKHTVAVHMRMCVVNAGQYWLARPNK